MDFGTKTSLSLNEAADDFWRVTRMVDETGLVVICEHNVPRYVVTDFGDYQHVQTADDVKVMRTALRLMDKHRRAFDEL